MISDNAILVGQSRKEFIRLDKDLIDEIRNKYCIYIQRRKSSYFATVKKIVFVWPRGKDSSTAKRIPLKRLIMGIKKNRPVEIRHINGNPLDLRKSNLEVVPSVRGKTRKTKLIKRS